MIERTGADLVGLQAARTLIVDESLSAEAFGNEGFRVLGTPALVALMETVAMAAIAPYLPDGAGTVGGRVELIHKAPTPVGMTIEVRARVVGVDDRAISFEVSASDAVEPIAEGTHVRFQVDRERFVARVDGKGTREP